ncbi:MAG: TdeIII family type II restriction endonuclease [Anaerolineae bacterium]
MLLFIALELDKGQEPQAFLSLTYNPFITREQYRHWPTFQIMDFEHQVLLGPEFWDALGGKGTYHELMQIVENVKQETSWS